MKNKDKLILHALATRIGVSLEELARRGDRINHAQKADAHRNEKSRTVA